MKKRLLSLLFVLFLSFAWLTTANAANETRKSHTFSVLGEKFEVRFHKSGYPNLVCGTQTKKGYGNVTVEEETNSSGHSTGYVIVRTVYTNSPTLKDAEGRYVGDTDTLECGWGEAGKNNGMVYFNFNFEPMKIESEATVTLQGRWEDGDRDTNSVVSSLYSLDGIVS
jgi:hypothetical protein